MEIVQSSSPVLNREIFEQVLMMDDGDDHEFSKSLIENYLQQAEETFAKMKNALDSGNLPELGTLGHFLKGSSAALGFDRLKDVCEQMQHYGKCRTVDGKTQLSSEQALILCRSCFEACLGYFEEVKEIYQKAYINNTDDIINFISSLPL